MSDPDVILIWRKCPDCSSCGERCRKAPDHLTDGDHLYWPDGFGMWRWAAIAADRHGSSTTLLWAIEHAHQAKKDRADARNSES